MFNDEVQLGPKAQMYILFNYRSHTRSSSFCRAPVANVPDVLQPCWLIVLLLDVLTLTTSPLQRDPPSQR
jgi:hypothetical protein